MLFCVFFFFKQKTAYEMLRSLVGSEMCIRDSTCAFHLLMHFGSCAYGSSCKIHSCDTLHDRQAILDFNSLVQDDPRWEVDVDASDDEGDTTAVVVGQSASTKWWVVPRL
eukprot:TRINITY_DN21859_c0_g1_i1.p1 TRINITY_DN21859_c0_g1~~TRINITY_DN21859_c0_g1_i1.p1  ORF type:complete len:110 (+),score=32.91 TRINITY_DN21859_c0_g1_i1:102-431(+)